MYVPNVLVTPLFTAKSRPVSYNKTSPEITCLITTYNSSNIICNEINIAGVIYYMYTCNIMQ